MAKKQPINPILAIVVTTFVVGALCFIAMLMLGSLTRFLPEGPFVEELYAFILLPLLYIVFPGASGIVSAYVLEKPLAFGTQLLTAATAFLGAHIPVVLLTAVALFSYRQVGDGVVSGGLLFFGGLTLLVVNVLIMTGVYLGGYHATRYLRRRR